MPHHSSFLLVFLTVFFFFWENELTYKLFLSRKNCHFRIQVVLLFFSVFLMVTLICHLKCNTNRTVRRPATPATQTYFMLSCSLHLLTCSNDWLDHNYCKSLYRSFQYTFYSFVLIRATCPAPS